MAGLRRGDAISLRQSPTLTPALLAAVRGNAKKSTSPRTARGKAQTRMNALRAGDRSLLLREFGLALFTAPFGGVEPVARKLLTPELARQRLFAESAQVAIQADLPDRERLRQINAMFRGKKKRDSLIFDIQSRDVIENKASPNAK